MTRRANQPVVIYDDGCEFCTSWAERVGRHFGDQVRVVGTTDDLDEIAELVAGDVPQSLVMRLPDGTVTTGAHAVFQILSLNRRWVLPLRLYSASPLFRRFTEFVYRQVARNRSRIAN